MLAARFLARQGAAVARATAGTGAVSSVLRVAPPVVAGAPSRSYTRKYGQRDRPRPYHKEKRRAKLMSEQPDGDFVKSTGKKYDDSNDPRLLKRHLKRAHDLAAESGFAKELAAFEEASAAFPAPAELHFAVLMERPAIISPDLEPWEAAFKRISDARGEAETPETPAELEKLIADMRAEVEAEQRRKREAALSGGTAGEAEGSAKRAEGGAGSAKDRRKAAEAAEAQSKFGADELERRAAALRGEGGEAGQFVASSSREVPRVTKNDELGNTRTLDRAYADRLVLVVREKESGRWTLPGAAFDEAATREAEAEAPSTSAHGEPLGVMAAAVRRTVTDALGPDVSPWVVGNGPVAVHLGALPEEERAAAGRYGRKVFLFRADILDGRVELGDAYDDFQWLTRLELREAGILEAGLGEVAFAAAGWDAQEHVRLAGTEPTADGVPSDEAIAGAAKAVLAAAKARGEASQAKTAQ